MQNAECRMCELELKLFDEASTPRKLLGAALGFFRFTPIREAQKPRHDDEPKPSPAQLRALETNPRAEQDETDQRQGDLGPGQRTHLAGPGWGGRTNAPR